jgi:hypothetical protein
MNGVPGPIVVLFILIFCGFGMCMGLLFGGQLGKTDQFSKDCKAMAHGAVDKSADSICAKNGKILFHQ